MSPKREADPLSPAKMSTIRCPSRVDFLNAVAKGHPPPPTRSHPYLRKRHVLRTSSMTSYDDSDEEAIPAFLNQRILDAMDRLDECYELKAIVVWLDDLRARHDIKHCLVDNDLTNGVALLDAMRIIYPPSIDKIERQLDEAGEVAKRNLERVRHALTAFPWKGDHQDDSTITPPNFWRIEDWALSGFVLLAGVVCDQSEKFVNQMLEFDDWVQQRLSDVVARGMVTLGVDHPEDEEDDDNVSDREKLQNERRRRRRAEQQVDSLKEELDILRDRCEQLERQLKAAKSSPSFKSSSSIPSVRYRARHKA